MFRESFSLIRIVLPNCLMILVYIWLSGFFRYSCIIPFVIPILIFTLGGLLDFNLTTGLGLKIAFLITEDDALGVLNSTGTKLTTGAFYRSLPFIVWGTGIELFQSLYGVSKTLVDVQILSVLMANDFYSSGFLTNFDS